MVRGLDGFSFHPRVEWYPAVAVCAVLKGPEARTGALCARSLHSLRWLWREGNTPSHSEQGR